jgi:hypothetical protein
MLSSPVCDLAPELQTSEIPEEFMKHPVYLYGGKKGQFYVYRSMYEGGTEEKDEELLE